jgi:hypothetical protein
MLRSEDRVEIGRGNGARPRPEGGCGLKDLNLMLPVPDAAGIEAEAGTAYAKFSSPGIRTEAAKLLGCTDSISRLVSKDSIESSSA